MYANIITVKAISNQTIQAIIHVYQAEYL